MSTPARNFPVVWVSNFVTAAGMTAFLPQFPLYLQEMGVEDPAAVRVWAGVLVGAAPLPAAFMGPVWGALGDRIGRKLMMVRAQLAIVVFDVNDILLEPPLIFAGIPFVGGTASLPVTLPLDTGGLTFTLVGLDYNPGNLQVLAVSNFNDLAVQ